MTATIARASLLDIDLRNIGQSIGFHAPCVPADKPERREWTLTDRITMHDNQGGLCGICMDRVPAPGTMQWHPNVRQPLFPVVDHILPLARGGDDVPENVQLVHWQCNATKGDRVDG